MDSGGFATRSRKRQEIKFEPSAQQTEEFSNKESYTPIRIEGILDFASGRQSEQLGLTTNNNEQYDIQVEAGMDDLVTSYWKQNVVVTGSYDGKYIYLEDIELLDG